MMNGLCAGMEHARTKRLTNQERRERLSWHQQELPELCDVLAGEGKCGVEMVIDVTTAILRGSCYYVHTGHPRSIQGH
jgi:hypothetical protein